MDIALQNLAVNVAYNENAAITVPQIKVRFIGKVTCFQSARQCLYRLATCSRRRRLICVRRISYKKTLAQCPRCNRRRRIVRDDNNGSVVALQCSVNCPDQAVNSVSDMIVSRLSSCDDTTFLIHCRISDACDIPVSNTSKRTSMPHPYNLLSHDKDPTFLISLC